MKTPYTSWFKKNQQLVDQNQQIIKTMANEKNAIAFYQSFWREVFVHLQNTYGQPTKLRLLVNSRLFLRIQSIARLCNRNVVDNNSMVKTLGAELNIALVLCRDVQKYLFDPDDIQDIEQLIEYLRILNVVCKRKKHLLHIGDFKNEDLSHVRDDLVAIFAKKSLSIS